MCINRGVDQEDVVHIHNGILFSHKDELKPFAETWMDLEIFILSEVSQSKEKQAVFGFSQLTNI